MASDLRPGRRLDRYVVESVVGAGGFATVYRARDTMLGRLVALKVLDPRAHRNPTVARRFLHEGRAVASLDHPAVVPVYDAGEHDDLLWMAMKLVAGRSLDRLLATGRRLTPAEVGALLERIGSALDHAHAQGVVHRDVKPSNILLEGDNPGGAWLADFGIAATARIAGRYTTGALGTAAYMAPEQARAREAGPAADVYSLACVVYELLAGRRPFPGDDHVGLLMAHATEPVPPLGPPDLDAVLARGLAKAPAARPSSAGALAAELAAVLDALPAPGEATALSSEAEALVAPTVAERRTVPYAPVRRLPPPPPPGAPPDAVSAPTGPTAAVPPRDPTVARRGRSRARRNLVFGAAALTLAGAAATVRTLAAPGDEGATRQCDEAGICLNLPDGWAVGEVRPGRVTLHHGGEPAAAYTHEPAPDDDPADHLARVGASGAACAGEPRPASVGDARGARCALAGGGVAAAVVDGGRLWVVSVDGSVPSSEADRLLDCIEFG